MKNQRFLCLAIGVLIFVLAGICSAGGGDPFEGLSGTLHIAGGTAHIALEKAAVKRIMRGHPGVRITIAGGGSGVGIKQVCEGLIDIGNTGRAPTPGEVKRCNLRVFKFAVDGIGVIVNPNRRIKGITRRQLVRVFSGEIDNWKELGGPDAGINVYTRDAESGTRKVFWKKGLGKADITLKANFVPSNAAMKTAIANDPYGIGYISLGVADGSVKLVAVDGIAPSVGNVVSGAYSISRGLFMNTRGDPVPLARAFISYLLSPMGQALVRDHGFIPVR